MKEPRADEERTSANGAFVDEVACANVRRTVAQLAARSSVLQALAADGDIAIVGAMYNVGTGKVEFLDEVQEPASVRFLDRN